MDEFLGKNIWIIGASSGIGEALAVALADKGANIILSARSADKLAKIEANLKAGHHMSLPLDVSDVTAFEQSFKLLQGKYKVLDSVVFMAAAYNPEASQNYGPQEIKSTIEINLTSAFYLLHYLIPLYEKQGYGQLALCASVAGYRGLPAGQPYCATKAALINLAETLRIDLLPKNIDVKVINPGFVRTRLTDKNKFEMPMMIEADEAAIEIVKGLQSNIFEIHFPKAFTCILKLFKLLPNKLYTWFVRKMKPQSV